MYSTGLPSRGDRQPVELHRRRRYTSEDGRDRIMIVKVRHVEKLRSLYGECAFVSKNKTIITIARQRNKRLATYSATLLHELLHVWIRVMELNGFKVDDDTEHDFIDAVEQAVLRLFKQVVGRK